jgi:hypothetical protein
MPFTQQRQLRLIQAGRAWSNAWKDLGLMFRQQQQHMADGKLTADEAYQQLYFQFSTATAPGTIISEAELVIREEAMQYRLTHRDNENRKNYQERKRREAGVIPRRKQIEPNLLEPELPSTYAGFKVGSTNPFHRPRDESGLPQQTEAELARYRAMKAEETKAQAPTIVPDDLDDTDVELG